MPKYAAKTSYESEGFRAHDYLTRAKESRPQWDYKPKSKLTSALTEERIIWRRAQTTDTVRRGALRSVPKQLEFNFGVSEREFEALAETWRRETGHFPTMVRKAMHPAYQRIIGMGRDAIPFILKDIQKQPTGAWFWALNAITGKDPAQLEDTVDGAIQAWLRWGKERGYI